jgi:hypothetical protein
MKTRNCGLIVGALGCLLNAAACCANPVVVEHVNTGFDFGTNAKLADGSFDTKYVLGPGSVAFVGATPFAWRAGNVPSTYLADGASNSSAWITVSTQEIAEGPYYFNLQVDLTGFSAQTALLQGFTYAADNELYRIIINQNVVYTNPAPQIITTEEFHNFISLGDMGLGSFVGGINTIQFEVLNFHRANVTVSPMAYRAEGAIVANPIPEPSSGWLLLLAAGILLVANRVQKHAACQSRRIVISK